MVGVGRSGLSLATILIPLLLKRRAADSSLSPYVATRTEIGPAAEGRKEDGWMDPACRDVCNLLCVADVQHGCIVAKTKRRRRGRSATCTSFSRIWTDKSFFSPSVSRTKSFRTYLSQTVKSQSISENLINYYYYYDRGLYT